MTEREAADACWKTYPGIHLVKYDVWNPTKGNQTERRGPVPPHFKMTKKTGPKPKLNKKDRARAKQYLDRDPDLSNTALAQKIETAKLCLIHRKSKLAVSVGYPPQVQESAGAQIP